MHPIWVRSGHPWCALVPSISRQALLPYPAERVYHLVNDVARYPEFVPGCAAVTLVSSSAKEVVASVRVEARGFADTFTTRNLLSPHECIDLELHDGPFDRLSGRWTFEQLGDVGCKVVLQLDYEIGGVLGMTLKPMVNRAGDLVLDAFVTRARTELA